MLGDPIFRIAFAISLSAHIFAVSAKGLLPQKPVDDTNYEIEVTYVIPEMPEEMKEAEAMPSLPKKYDLERKKTELAAKKAIAEEEGLTKVEAPAEDEKYIEEEELEKLEDYIQYYELIRERIRKYVMRNCSSFVDEGGVDLLFTLTDKGALKTISVDESRSVKSSYLKKAALRSVRKAAPFPSFPDSLERGELTFSISIVFKGL